MKMLKEALSHVTFFPFKVSISAGLLLKVWNEDEEEYAYRYFHAGTNTLLGNKVFYCLLNNTTALNKIKQHLQQDDYIERLKNEQTGLGSRWIFIGISDILIKVYAIR